VAGDGAKATGMGKKVHTEKKKKEVTDPD